MSAIFVNLPDLRRVFDAIESLGGVVPRSIQAALDSVEAWHQAAQGRAVLPKDLIEKSTKRAASKGRSMTREEAWDLAQEAVSSEGLPAKFAQVVTTSLDYDAAEMIHGLLRGAAGDQLMGSLQEGGFEEAVSGIQGASEYYSADTTAEQVVDKGAKAVVAWNKAKEWNAHLDRVLNEVLRPISLMGLVPPELLTGYQPWLLAGWLIDPARAYQLNEVGAVLNMPTTNFKVPGGRWLRINAIVGAPRLNSPRVVTEIFQGLADSEKEQEAERQRQADLRVATFGAGPVHTVRR